MESDGVGQRSSGCGRVSGGGMSDGNGKAPLCALFFVLSGCYIYLGVNKGVVTYCKIILKKRG